MKCVGCPTCDLIFETEGFRPMTFFCPECNTEGDWYAADVDGVPRGCIEWTPDISYMDEVMSDFLLLEEVNYEQFGYSLKVAQTGAIAAIATLITSAEMQLAIAEAYKHDEAAQRWAEAITEIQAVLAELIGDFETFSVDLDVEFSMAQSDLETVEADWYNLAMISDDLSSDFPEMVQKDNKAYILPQFQESADEYNWTFSYILEDAVATASEAREQAQEIYDNCF